MSVRCVGALHLVQSFSSVFSWVEGLVGVKGGVEGEGGGEGEGWYGSFYWW